MGGGKVTNKPLKITVLQLPPPMWYNSIREVKQLKIKEAIRGDAIGKRANDWYVWVTCPECRKGRWILRWKLKLPNFTKLCWGCSACRNVGRGRGSRPNNYKEPIKTAARVRSQKGNKNANWKGGLTALVRGIRRSPEYYQWRKVVLARDNHICQDCGATENIEAHHVKAIMDYPEGIFEISNGLTVCATCHNRYAVLLKKIGVL